MANRRRPLLPLDQTARLSLDQAAHRYAEAGVAVLPLVPGTKRPALEHGFHEASTDHTQITGWWSRLPTANIGIRTGDQVDVLDIDVHASGTGFSRLHELLDAGLADRWAHAVRTPSGGLHLYYPSDPDRTQRNWSRASAHIDFRGVGGYIVAAPSQITHTGVRRGYEPLGASYPGNPVEADRIRDLLTPTHPRPVLPQQWGPAESSLDEYGQQISTWLEGFEGSDRSGALFWSACRLVEAGADELTSYAHLAEPATALGMTQREVTSTIRRAHQATSPEPEPTGGYRNGPARARMVGRSLS